MSKEQYWIDTLKPDYNLLSNAGNSIGFKHRSETIEKMRSKALGRKHTLEVRMRMSEDRKGINSFWYGKKLSTETKNKIRISALKREKSSKTGFSVEVLDTQTSIKTTYPSLRKACEAIGSHLSTINRQQKKQIDQGITNSTFFLKKKRYVLTIISTNN